MIRGALAFSLGSVVGLESLQDGELAQGAVAHLGYDVSALRQAEHVYQEIPATRSKWVLELPERRDG